MPSKPKLHVPFKKKMKAYFDIQSPSDITCVHPVQNLVVNSPAIKEITVSQFLPIQM